MIDIRRAVTENQLADVYSVRRIVFIEEQGVPESLEIDDKEKESVHFILYKDTMPAGAARLRFAGDKGKAERVCIKKDHRGTGLGRLLMSELEAEASRLGAKAVLLNAQVHAQAFYTEAGYRVTSEAPFLDAGIEHVTMEKDL
ncbi:GNAT family N-acetyltransferase [Alkalicoccus saliphilus]|uniref:GNAT family N-acetyltransferase n=1 Tax=Alkalicoccus saliphilus TaxID=200989 RepID=A0A2T4UA41_9BACI|nr:GNAT family N-acetyltransferase [Alkalicoccus saliphilus]PTL40250.1 GNAT family N-acetyltransferase [Alkalicoccus saliphilus]